MRIKLILSLLQFITSYFSEKKVVFFLDSFCFVIRSASLYQSVYVLVNNIVVLFFKLVNNIVMTKQLQLLLG